MKMKRTFFQQMLEATASAIFAFPFIYLLMVWNTLPEKIPGHYDLAGNINRWANREELLILPVVGIVLWALLTLVSTKPKWWNIPVAEASRTEQTYSRTFTMLLETKVIIGLTFAFLTYNSTAASPLPGWFLPVALATLGAVLIVGVVRIVKSVG